MKMLWDANYLYFYAQMEEPHVWTTIKQKNTVISYNNEHPPKVDNIPDKVRNRKAPEP